MPNESKFKEAFMKEGGCGLIIYAAGAFMFGSFIYLMIVGFGDPEVKKIRDACWDRESDRIGRPGFDLSEQEAIIVVQRCDAVVKQYLDIKRRK